MDWLQNLNKNYFNYFRNVTQSKAGSLCSHSNSNSEDSSTCSNSSACCCSIYSNVVPTCSTSKNVPDCSTFFSPKSSLEQSGECSFPNCRGDKEDEREDENDSKPKRLQEGETTAAPKTTTTTKIANGNVLFPGLPKKNTLKREKFRYLLLPSDFP